MSRRPFLASLACLLLAACQSAAPAPTPLVIFVTPEPTAVGATGIPLGSEVPSGAPSGLTSGAPTSGPSSGATSGATTGPTTPPTAEPTPTAAPTVTPTPKPTPKPIPTPSPTPSVPLTKIVLADIGLNDPDDPSTPDREVTFSSDGTGNVAVRVDQGAGDSGRFKLCLQFESKAPFCQVTTGVSTITGRTLKQKTKWHVTLQGATLGMVTSVDLTITFPAKVPSLSGKDFYLSGGQTYPGFVASFKSRRACPITLVLSNLNPAGTYNTVVEDAGEPGSVAPPAAAGCPTPAAGAATYDTIKGHQYKISITSDYGEETFAGISLGWP